MNIALLLIINHWIADFVMQTDEMAVNKSKSMDWLAKHLNAYIFSMIPMTLYASFKFGFWVSAGWLLLNGLLHFITDFFTSRLTSRLWQKGDRHNFFVVIGFDQVIHYACLILTWQLMV